MTKDGRRDTKKKQPMGGFREGSGRKPIFAEKMVQSSISLPQPVVDMLDDLKGDQSRAEICRTWIIERAEQESRIAAKS